ncbi:MAG: glycosyltransferase family 2 protein [Bacteroidota bacterium]
MIDLPAINDKKKLISVGLPVFNGEKYLRQAINSLLSQTYLDIEVIISDNASVDNTEEICREFMLHDKRVQYFRQTNNIGAIKNFQFVLEKASGDFFLWAAHDDIRHPDAINKMFSVFEEDETVGLVFSDIVVTDYVNNKSIKYTSGYTSSHTKKIYKYLFRLIYSPSPVMFYGLHRTSILKSINFSNFDYFDIYITHWYELNSSIKTIPLFLYTCGTHGNRIPYSLTHQYLSYKVYLQKEWKLLRNHFNIFISIFLYSIAAYLIWRNTILHNALIRKHQIRK